MRFWQDVPCGQSHKIEHSYQASISNKEDPPTLETNYSGIAKALKALKTLGPSFKTKLWNKALGVKFYDKALEQSFKAKLLAS